MANVKDMIVKDYCHEVNISAKTDTAIKEISHKMEKNNIQHIPIIEDNKFIGLISDRDLKLVAGIDYGVDFSAGKIMTKEPYIVSPETKVVEILDYFIQNKVYAALVDGKDQLSIFTAHDALKMLKDLD